MLMFFYPLIICYRSYSLLAVLCPSANMKASRRCSVWQHNCHCERAQRIQNLKYMMGILHTFEILRFAQYDNTTVILKERSEWRISNTWWVFYLRL